MDKLFQTSFKKNFTKNHGMFKVFSGDLPEISICIIQNLRNNFNTLSLALVNRFWSCLGLTLVTDPDA